MEPFLLHLMAGRGASIERDATVHWPALYDVSTPFIEYAASVKREIACHLPTAKSGGPSDRNLHWVSVVVKKQIYHPNTCFIAPIVVLDLRSKKRVVLIRCPRYRRKGKQMSAYTSTGTSTSNMSHGEAHELGEPRRLVFIKPDTCMVCDAYNDDVECFYISYYSGWMLCVKCRHTFKDELKAQVMLSVRL